MTDSDRHARYAAATGIFFFVLVVIGFVVQHKPPASDASATEVLEYVKDHRDNLHLVQAIFGLAGFFFIWFIGALRSLLGRAEGGEGRLATTAYGGGLIAVATLMVGLGLAAAAELHPAADPEITRALIDASLLVPAVGAPAAAVFFLGNGLSILRSGYLPSWLGWLGIVAAVFNAIGISAVFTDHGAFAGDGVIGFFAGFLLFIIWVLAASIALVRKLGEGGTEGGAAPA
jgi:hypothetical protein